MRFTDYRLPIDLLRSLLFPCSGNQIAELCLMFLGNRGMANELIAVIGLQGSCTPNIPLDFPLNDGLIIPMIKSW